MVTKTVAVQQIVKVTVDESKFTPEFMESFRQTMFHFTDIDDHLEHLAQLYARGIHDNLSTFIEGYGPPKEMGIKAQVTDVTEEIMTL
jgi:hypothetical protein